MAIDISNTLAGLRLSVRDYACPECGGPMICLECRDCRPAMRVAFSVSAASSLVTQAEKAFLSNAKLIGTADE